MTAEHIISKHIHDLDKRMDSIVEYELYMVDNDCVLSDEESKDLDQRYHALLERKCELMGILAEIEDVAIEHVVLY